MLAFFSNMRISAKLMVGIASLAVLSIFVAALGAISLNSVASEARQLADREAEAIRLAGTINTLHNRSEQLWLLSVIEHDRPDFEAFVAEVETANAEVDASIASLEKLVDENDQAKIAELREGLANYRKETAKIPPLWYQERLGDAEDVLQHESKEPFKIAAEAATHLSNSIRERADVNSQALSDNANTTILTLVIVSVIGLAAIGGAILIMIRSQITQPLADMTTRMGDLANGNTAIDVAGTDRKDEIGDMARAVIVFRDNAKQQAVAEAEQKDVVDTLSQSLNTLSHGDLTVSIGSDFPDAYGEVRSNFNDAVTKLRDLISSVMESSASIRTGSREIATASEDLARRTESNAASLEETSAAISQMDERLKATAESAKRTVGRADGAIKSVSGGRSVADEAVQAMGRVSESAQGIDSVIEGLDKIAFQTRVLAMNAAVEAGRAGEAGRGFAVVADLVSALAMRAEEEAQLARDQLTAAQTDIVSAVDAVERVDSALVAITDDVGEVHKLLTTMADDNLAQSGALGEITISISEMDRSTQQNAAMVEEASAGARNLSSEAELLASQAGSFTVKATGSSRLASRRPGLSVSNPAAMSNSIM